jgi:hypothetical protein
MESTLIGVGLACVIAAIVGGGVLPENSSGAIVLRLARRIRY